MKTAVLVFGNEYIRQDNLAVRIAEKLKIEDVDFLRCYSVDELFKYQDYEKIYILDVVKNARDVVLIDNIDILKKHKLYTMHDFDLGFFIKILKEIGKLNEIRIIGIPEKGNMERIKEKVIEIMKTS